jgi:zinc protease
VNARDVDGFWDRGYRPDAMTVIVAGDTTVAEVRDLVSSAFGDWTTPARSLPVPAVPPPYKAQVAYVDVPDARETNVIVGRRAGAIGDPRTLAGEVANAIVGGGVDGRLDRELHVKLALTFGASSSFWRGVAGGSWAAAATFDTPNTVTGLRAMLAVLASARTAAPTDAEVAAARRDLLAAARASHDTTLGTARAVERLVLARQPLVSHATLAARLTTLTHEQIRDALPLDELSIVIVGDWSRIGSGLADLGAATPYPP